MLCSQEDTGQRCRGGPLSTRGTPSDMLLSKQILTQKSVYHMSCLQGSKASEHGWAAKAVRRSFTCGWEEAPGEVMVWTVHSTGMQGALAVGSGRQEGKPAGCDSGLRLDTEQLDLSRCDTRAGRSRAQLPRLLH